MRGTEGVGYVVFSDCCWWGRNLLGSGGAFCLLVSASSLEGVCWSSWSHDELDATVQLWLNLISSVYLSYLLFCIPYAFVQRAPCKPGLVLLRKHAAETCGNSICRNV
ncbi:hypothetical protein K503DRAFT_587764 [Rhizopogon vinicolor AM-OR11-026]|uniref:Uncharacterized protein n=1 Tax=Rhizopogon vinicolor AM-OR11-026 TaxID=1314800 RepID=A0A1B7MJC1_9AGAM|nr:hypothetical protein K503DRAFT_587764 [Rhizopogon vinicolor AM-OR11-026]